MEGKVWKGIPLRAGGGGGPKAFFILPPHGIAIVHGGLR